MQPEKYSLWRSLQARPSRTSSLTYRPSQAMKGSPREEFLSHRRNLMLSGVAVISQSLTAFLPATAVTGSMEKSGFDPGTVEVGWEIYFGAAAGVFPFLIGSWEFGKRIVIQRRCPECKGSGLISKGEYKFKCQECGGFFPWQGWAQFLSATGSPGNGGVLRQPRGQSSILYKIPEAKSDPLRITSQADKPEKSPKVDELQE